MAHKPKQLKGMHVAIWVGNTQKFAHVLPETYRSEAEFLNEVQHLLVAAGDIQAILNDKASGAMPTSSDVSEPEH
jgi:hypothetical protein